MQRENKELFLEMLEMVAIKVRKCKKNGKKCPVLQNLDALWDIVRRDANGKKTS